MIKVSAKVTVGFCVKNAERKLSKPISSIAKQDFPHSLMKLVVVDDGSTDKTLSLVKELVSEIDIKTTVLSSGGKGLASSRQMVVDNAEGEYIVWVDDAFDLAKDFIRKHVEFMEKNPDVGAATGKLISGSDTTVAMLDNAYFVLPVCNLKKIGTGGSIFRLQAILRVGGFDVNIKGAGEDYDISRRITQSGWVLRNDKSAELHKNDRPATLRDLWRKHSWYGYGNHLLYHKFKDRSLLLGSYPLLVLLEGLKSSCQIYRIICKKKVFLLPFLSFFISIAANYGFIRAHITGYGHFSGSNLNSENVSVNETN